MPPTPVVKIQAPQIGATNDGDLLIGSASTGGFKLGTITPGANIIVTPGDGTLSIAASAPGTGTVTSVDVSGGTTGLTTSGGPVTTSGTITLTGTLVVANGGTGRASLTNHGVLVGAATTAITQLSVGTNGQVLIGATAADPVFQTISGSGATITMSAAGVITISAIAAASLPSLDAITAPAADVSLNSHKITNLTDPSSVQDAATKGYVDGVAQGLSPKTSCQAATAAVLATNTYSNGASGIGATLTGVATGVLTVDGYTVALNDRVLVKNEVAGSHNGIYLCTVAGAVGVAYVLTRATDSDTASDLETAFVFIENGTANAATGWVNSNTGTITIGTTALTYTQFSGAGTYTNGTGLSLTGTVFSVNYGTSSTTACVGNDSRLSDARTPVGTALTSASIWVGNGSNVAAAAAVSGSGATITLSNAGVITISAIANSSLTNSSVTVNGTSIALGASGTVTAAAGTLTGATLAAGVTASSLTSVGTIATGTWQGTQVDGAYGGVPTGAIMPYGAATAPAGFVLCDGTSLLRAGTYANLFAVIGTTFGTVDGTHFTVPDLRGRSPMGNGTGTGLTARTIGTNYGAEGVKITVATMPAHTHDVQVRTTDTAFSTGRITCGNGLGTAVDKTAAAITTGGDGDHANIHPVLAVGYIIKI